jgi:hypothetical protein
MDNESAPANSDPRDNLQNSTLHQSPSMTLNAPSQRMSGEAATSNFFVEEGISVKIQ